MIKLNDIYTHQSDCTSCRWLCKIFVVPADMLFAGYFDKYFLKDTPFQIY
jgi:hypothetical protein